MIIYGGGSKDLGSRKLQGYKCTNCEATDVHVHAVVQYGTLFFIPLFPANKKYTSVCGNCNQVLIKEQMPQRMLDKIKLEKHHFKSPVYLYAGLVIIILFVSYLAYSIIQKEKELEKNLQNLQPKSVVVFKVNSEEYSFAEVVSHRNDTVFMYYGNYVIDQSPDRADIDEEREKVKDFFSEDLFFFTQKELDSLYDKGEIEEIIKY